jgi:hypothetical protein
MESQFNALEQQNSSLKSQFIFKLELFNYFTKNSPHGFIISKWNLTKLYQKCHRHSL